MCILLFLSTVLRSSLEEAALELFMFPSVFWAGNRESGEAKLPESQKRERRCLWQCVSLWLGGLGAYIKIVGMGRVSGEPPLLYHVNMV